MQPRRQGFIRLQLFFPYLPLSLILLSTSTFQLWSYLFYLASPTGHMLQPFIPSPCMVTFPPAYLGVVAIVKYTLPTNHGINPRFAETKNPKPAKAEMSLIPTKLRMVRKQG
ncbi:hypothetical protein F4813DRAFT_342694 [Daldinia decipiens]|uniref:uncharacterized protein n=1 Tax=Daldinia decipiens TaxID=326647 RepID=UPI0020C24960|nr:uncharacterized protein F4813DRAFT_342694 [Daldinia decipiens]KAI1663024.1 hypothetical protein F4813DRAFT_342694 [Daldinia decipiens]